MEQQIPEYNKRAIECTAVAFVRRYNPYATLSEALEAYAIYRAYRDEGQSDIVSRQYAGLL